MNYTPSKWGAEFHALQVDEALGGGAQGVGKSMALFMDPAEQVVVQQARCEAREFAWGQAPGWALHLRREFPRLEQTIWRSKMIFPSLDAGVKWNETAHKWTFSSGYQYQFGHLKDADSFFNYRSNEYTHLGIDELIELESQDMYNELVLRVRTTDPVLRKMKKVRATTNPGAGWVRDYFVDPAPQGRTILQRKIRLEDGTYETRTRLFLPGRLVDNPNAEFRRDQEATLRNQPSHLRAMLLDGDWYVVAGAFFAEVWDSARMVIKPFKIPSGWRRLRSGDWGYKEPCVILWWTVSPDGELICYRERTFNGPKAEERLDAYGVAHRIREIERANGEWNLLRDCSRLTGFMDNQLWEERGHRGPTMADDMAKVGVHWQKATKGRKQAAQQFIKRARSRGYNDRPGVMFFETCGKCISTIPAIGTDDMDPEKPKDGGPDHWWAATGYACAANLLPSGVEDRSLYYETDDDEKPAQQVSNRGSYGYGAN